MSAEFRRKSIFAALICVSLVFAIGAWSGPGAEKKPQSPYNDEEYKEIIAQQVGDIYQLEAWAAAVQDDFMPILPPVPEFILKQPAGPQVLPFDAKSFPPSFVSGMAGIYENSVPVYPVLVVEDPATRVLTFYNLDNEAVYTLPPPAGYDPFAFLKSRWPGLFTGGANEAARRNMMQLYDPARIQVRARLIDSDNLAHWIYTKRQIEVSQLSLLSGGSVEMKMMLGDAPNSNIFFTVVKRATNFVSMTIQYPSGFTNGLDVFTCNDLMAEIWGFGVKNLATTGTNVTWIDTNAWVVSGYPLRLYAAADASTDGDGDGYADGREIMVYGTDPMSSNSHPVTVSGTVSYSGIETGGVYVLFTQDTDSWSIAKSVWQASPGAYTNDEIGNGTSYWFKAFRDANGNFTLDPWEARGTYSNSSTYVSGSLSNVDITITDVPSIWGQISYSGSATGDIHVLAVTGSNSWDETYSVTIPYIQSEDGSGGVYYVTFPVNYTLTDLPASNYWIRAYMDTDTNGTVSLLDPAGQYSSNSIPVSNRTTGINITMAYESDGDGMADWWEMQHWSNLSQGGGGDTDGDGLLNSNEFAVGANPNLTDTDGDGMPDGWEQANGLSATNAADAAEDKDGDGIPNGIEQQIGTAANSPDPVYDVSSSEVTITNRSQAVHAWKEGYVEFGYSYETSAMPPRIFLSYCNSNACVWIGSNTNYVETDYYTESRMSDPTLRREVLQRFRFCFCEYYRFEPPEPPFYVMIEYHDENYWDIISTCTDCIATQYWDRWYSTQSGIEPYPGLTNWPWSCDDPVPTGWQVTNDLISSTATQIVWQNVQGDATNSCHRWLENEFTTFQLTNMAMNELTALGAITGLDWGTGILWCGVCPGTNWNTAATSSMRDLSHDERSNDIRRVQYRLCMPSTSTGGVYRAIVFHLYTPEGAGTSIVLGVTNLWAKGTGGAATFTPTNGVTIEPPEQDGVVRPVIGAIAVEFVDAGKNATDHVKIAKWDNAFFPGTSPKDDFIDLDVDCFAMRVRDLFKIGQGALDLEVSTDSPGDRYDDDWTLVELKESPAGSGVFISTNMLLVSDECDDTYLAANVPADDTDRDPTHRLALGGSVAARYTTSGSVYTATAVLAPSVKTVTVDVVVLETNGLPVLPLSEVSNHWSTAQERFAQVGVCLHYSICVANAPPGVDLSDGLMVTSNDYASFRLVAQETRALISAVGTTNTAIDIHVFYVTTIDAFDTTTQRGIALADFWFEESEEPYLYNLVVSAAPRVFTVAHELAHLLGDNEHVDDGWNLLYISTSSDNEVTATKRLTSAQEERIREDGHVQ